MLEWDRKYMAVGGVILLLLGFFIGMKYSARKYQQELLLLEETMLLAAAPAAEEYVAQDVIVYIGGAVEQPGVYTLPAGARVHEVVMLASPSGEANLDVIGMARELEDGETLYVPGREAGEEGGEVNNWVLHPSASAAGKININRASAQELAAGLPGVGEVIAQRIVDYREANGKFSAIEELKQVSGIGDKKYAAIEALITVR